MNLKVQSMNQRKLVVKTLALYHIVKHLSQKSTNSSFQKSITSQIFSFRNCTCHWLSIRFQSYRSNFHSKDNLLLPTASKEKWFTHWMRLLQRRISWRLCIYLTYDDNCCTIKEAAEMGLHILRCNSKNWRYETGKPKKRNKKIPTSSQVGGKKIKIQQFEEYVRNGNQEDGAKFAAKYAKLFPVAETALLLMSKSAEIGKLYLEEVKKLHPFKNQITVFKYKASKFAVNRIFFTFSN